jgi:DNA polymerase-3 subunit beta
MASTALQTTPTLAVPRLALQRLVALLFSVNGLRSLVPAFTRTLFVGGPNGVIARATNEMTDLAWRVSELTASAPLAFSLPGRQFRELVTAFDGASVSAEVLAADAALQLSCGHYTGRLPAQMEPADVSAMPTLPATAWRTRVSRTAFRRAIEAVRYASPRASDTARQGMFGLLVSVQGTALTVTATDGHRLAHATVQVETPVETPVRIQFRMEAVQVLSGVLDRSASESVTLDGEKFADGRWLVSGDEFALSIAGLGDATFPEFKRMLPTAASHPTHVNVSRVGLLGALTRVSLSSDLTTRRVTLAGTEDLGLFDGVMVSACAADMGEASEVVMGEGKLTLRMAVNPEYLAESAKQGESVSVAMSFRSADSPVVLADVEDGATILHLVMPVRIG